VIFEIYGIIFLKKILWNRFMDQWTESTRPAHGSMRFSLNQSHSLKICGLDLKISNRHMSSNLRHPSRNGWTR
jgi:hypothetical protein